MHGTKENNIIPMIFDEAFTVKWLPKSGDNRTTRRRQNIMKKCLSCHLRIFDIQQHYAQCLVKLNIGKKQNIYFMRILLKDFHVAESFYELSQLNIELNEPNKAFLFGINYVILSDDKDF